MAAFCGPSDATGSSPASATSQPFPVFINIPYSTLAGDTARLKTEFFLPRFHISLQFHRADDTEHFNVDTRISLRLSMGTKAQCVKLPPLTHRGGQGQKNPITEMKKKCLKKKLLPPPFCKLCNNSASYSAQVSSICRENNTMIPPPTQVSVSRCCINGAVHRRQEMLWEIVYRACVT